MIATRIPEGERTSAAGMSGATSMQEVCGVGGSRARGGAGAMRPRTNHGRETAVQREARLARERRGLDDDRRFSRRTKIAAADAGGAGAEIVSGVVRDLVNDVCKGLSVQSEASQSLARDQLAEALNVSPRMFRKYLTPSDRAQMPAGVLAALLACPLIDAEKRAGAMNALAAACGLAGHVSPAEGATASLSAAALTVAEKAGQVSGAVSRAMCPTSAGGRRVTGREVREIAAAVNDAQGALRTVQVSIGRDRGEKR